MDTLLHICSRSDWEQAQERGEYRAASLASEGFIHLSAPDQVAATADRFYRGRRGLILLVIDARLLGAAVRYEAADGALFPHLYGPLNLDAVVEVRPFEPGASGGFGAPTDFSARG